MILFIMCLEIDFVFFEKNRSFDFCFKFLFNQFFVVIVDAKNDLIFCQRIVFDDYIVASIEI